MADLPQRVSLVSQTSAYILSGIEAGEWMDWLPGERALCQMVQVSRNTLRMALAKLQADGALEAIHGTGHRILKPARNKTRPSLRHDVAILTPEPLERLRPSHTLWIDELRGMLGERHCRLRVFHGHRYFRSRPGPVLSQLVTRHRHGCWILVFSSEPMQRWFARKKLPCIVAGSIHEDLDLPCRDLEHRAICRHAVGVLLGFGHRRIGLLVPKSKRAGDLASEAGFLEGINLSTHPGTEGTVVAHDEDVAKICRAVCRVMSLASRPSALVIANPYVYLTVAGKLAQMGIRIPEDVSLISRESEPFLRFAVPSAVRYVTNPHDMAQTLLGPVLDLLNGGVIMQKRAYLMPEFLRGESIGRLPAG